MNEPELKINGTYLVENDGTMQGMDIENKIYTDKLDINLSGQTPTGGYLEYENSKLKNGCLTFDEYKVTIENGEAKEVEKGSCENQSLTACDSPNFHPSEESWFNYTEDASTNTLTITGPSNIWTSITDENLKKTDIVIPCSISGKSVKIIGSGAFAGRGFTSVVIGDSVETIENSAFAANNIEKLIISNNVVTIGNDAFVTNKINDLKLGNNLQTIGKSAFLQNSFENIIIPNSVSTIGESAFVGNKIKTLILGNGLREIGASAFALNNIESIIIPSNLTIIGLRAYNGNPNLKTIYDYTGKDFDWGSIVGGNYNSETGIVENEYGNVEIKKSN